MSKKILIVDDSEVERTRLSNILRAKGYEITEASSGDEAIQKAIESKPELILMDVMMPGINGFQTTKYLHKTPETANIPVIIITSKEADTDKAWGLKQGAVKYLVKPVNEADLLKACAEH